MSDQQQEDKIKQLDVMLMQTEELETDLLKEINGCGGKLKKSGLIVAIEGGESFKTTVTLLESLKSNPGELNQADFKKIGQIFKLYSGLFENITNICKETIEGRKLDKDLIKEGGDELIGWMLKSGGVVDFANRSAFIPNEIRESITEIEGLREHFIKQDTGPEEEDTLAPKEQERIDGLEPTIENILKEISSGKSYAAHNVIGRFTASEEGEAFIANISNDLSDKEAKTFVDDILKKYHEACVSIKRNQHQEYLNFILQLNAMAQALSHNQDALEIIKGMQKQIDKQLVSVEELKPLSENYKAASISSMQEAWDISIDEHKGINKLDDNSVEISQGVIARKDGNSLKVSLNPPSVDNLETAVGFLKKHCSETGTKVISVSFKDVNALKSLFV
ncbi:MAG: hypothetical protein JKY54_11850 [Flavobacteriales bacterium]|nr:hypothetical protein [Flavobacteriales bacterium]